MSKSLTSGLLVIGGGAAVTVTVAGFVSVERSIGVLGLLVGNVLT